MYIHSLLGHILFYHNNGKKADCSSENNKAKVSRSNISSKGWKWQKTNSPHSNYFPISDAKMKTDSLSSSVAPAVGL